jgi:uncharacterized membrane protein
MIATIKIGVQIIFLLITTGGLLFIVSLMSIFVLCLLIVFSFWFSLAKQCSLIIETNK